MSSKKRFAFIYNQGRFCNTEEKNPTEANGCTFCCWTGENSNVEAQTSVFAGHPILIFHQTICRVRVLESNTARLSIQADATTRKESVGVQASIFLSISIRNFALDGDWIRSANNIVGVDCKDGWHHSKVRDTKTQQK